MSVLDKYSCEGQMSLFDQGTWCGKMLQEPSAQTMEKTLGASSKKPRKSQIKAPLFLDLRGGGGHTPDSSYQMDGASLIAFMMHNTGAFLKDVKDYVLYATLMDNPQETYCLNCGEKPLNPNPTYLSQILEMNPDPKYQLSPKACQGILRRAQTRGKKLPEILEQALIKQAATPSKSGGGAERDRYGKRAGKGALVQTELSGTLGVSQDQTLFTQCISIDEKMGNTYVHDNLGNTLSARDYKQPQSVIYGIGSYDSNAMKSPNPHSGIYEADTSRTLDLNGGNPGCNQGGMAVVCLEGNGSRPSHRGDGYSETETMYTLNSTEQHAVCTEDIKTNNKKQTVYDWRRQDARMTENKDVCVTAEAAWGGGGNNMPYVLEETNKPQTYQDTTGSLMASGYNKLGTQEAANDMFVVQSMEVFHCTSEEDKAQTLKARDYKDPQIVAYPENKDPQMVCYGLDRASFNQGKNAQYDFSVEEEKAQTLVSRGPGGGTNQTVGALCARDYKGIGNQDVSDGKYIIQSVRQSSNGQQDGNKRG